MFRALSSDQHIDILAAVLSRVAISLDILPEPATMWAQDIDTGDTVLTYNDMMNGDASIPGNTMSVFNNLVVTENLLDSDGNPLLTGETTINCLWPAIKYLVEQRKWSMSDAAVLSASLCGGCMNVVLMELGEDMEGHDPYKTNTFCVYCKYIRPNIYEERIAKDPNLIKEQHQFETRHGSVLTEVVNAVKNTHREIGTNYIDLKIHNGIMNMVSYIRKLPNENKWRVYSESGKNMGTFDSELEAKKRLRQVEYFKHSGATKMNRY